MSLLAALGGKCLGRGFGGGRAPTEEDLSKKNKNI